MSGEFYDKQLVFANEHFVIIDKPAGFLTIPARQADLDARPCAQILLTVATGERLLPVHRLDADVSGLVMFARHARAHTCANQWFQKRQMLKVYEALSEIPPQQGENMTCPKNFIWESRLLRGKKRTYEKPFGKVAITEATFSTTIAWHDRNWALWQLFPRTGRPHQLRFEMAKHKTPIVGDRLYGSAYELIPGGIALRAVALSCLNGKEWQSFGLPNQLQISNLKSHLRASKIKEVMGL